MLGRQAIRDRASLVNVRRQNRNAIAVRASRATAILAALLFGLRNHLLREFAPRRNKDGYGLWIVFCLGDKIGGDLRRISASRSSLQSP